jgi:hypothetical protein
MGNTVTVTQTYVGLTKDGKRVYNVKAAAHGNDSSAEVAIPITRLKKILGTPGFTIAGDTQGTPAWLTATSVSGTTVTLTASKKVETEKTLTVAAQVFGN